MKPQRARPLVLLTEADPCFYDWSPDRALNPHLADKPDRKGLGLMFMCPIHEDCWVGIPFKNAIDGGGPHEPERASWQRTGETFDVLTLSPSIRVLGGADGCEWHGFIRNGRFETCGDAR